MELKNLKVNCLGDSITEGHGASDPSKCYVSRLASDYGIKAVNYGIGGTRIAAQKKTSADPRYDLDFCSRFNEMDDYADVILVFGGTNDFGHGDALLGTFTDRTPETFYGGLHTLYRGLIEKYPSAKIAIITPLHRWNEQNPLGDGNKEVPTAPLKKYVEIIREVAEYYSLPVLDLFASSGIQPAVPLMKELYMPDALHPNDAGYKILADKIAGFLKNLY